MHSSIIYRNTGDFTVINKYAPDLTFKDSLLCLSHLRWNFVYQRPQHLMKRFATKYTVLYIEEPIYVDKRNAYLVSDEVKDGALVLVPHIPKNIDRKQEEVILQSLVSDFIQNNNYNVKIKWYLTPMMLPWSKHIFSDIIIYDCMDELSAFKNAPPQLKALEKELLQMTNLVFTGGLSLYKAKSLSHLDVHLFPSSVDIPHFTKARGDLEIPFDQKNIPEPRIGFYGVIDERLDIKLLKSLAISKPEWSFVIIGPVIKIDINDLPQLPNIYYLGAKTYDELPYYLCSWRVALIPFIINESTKFISPTKTPEFLAAGLPVVSTPINDIVETYQTSEVVYTVDATDLSWFIFAIDSALKDSKDKTKVYRKADFTLHGMSWDKTFIDMYKLVLKKQQEVINNVR